MKKKVPEAEGGDGDMDRRSGLEWCDGHGVSLGGRLYSTFGCQKKIFTPKMIYLYIHTFITMFDWCGFDIGLVKGGIGSVFEFVFFPGDFSPRRLIPLDG
jgi:hypothetical protein